MRKVLTIATTALMLLMFMPASHADESIGLEFPVDDAKLAASQRNYEFLGMDLDDGVTLPGLNEEQSIIVKRKHKVRLLNYRWQTYTNIEERKHEFERIQSYAARYNVTMWQEMKQQQLKDFKKYRY